MLCREIDAQHSCNLTIGRFAAGSSGNIIPDSAVMEGSVRTNHSQTRARATQRIEEIVRDVSRTFGCTAEIQWTSRTPCLVCDENFTLQMTEFIGQLAVPHLTATADMSAAASEDFACIAQQLPAAMIYLAAGFDDQRGNFTAHNPQVCFNEDVCPFGAAVYAHCAFEWLKAHK